MSERLGATLAADGRCAFVLWAPNAESVELVLDDAARVVPMERDGHGYHRVEAGDVEAGSAYRFRLAGVGDLPDPASRSQPAGVHGPSRVVDLAYPWTDEGWRGHALNDYVVYELHVGTFTAEGTFDAIVPHLARLRALGVTAIEIMPVAQFPGERNWGYDGVALFATQHSYGGARALQRLVDACHAADLAVVLDVVYNHLGPEGNYLGAFAPYFTDAYQTPWGAALNFDGPASDDVRRFFIENALQWLRDFHVDALRLDATHAIIDRSARPFLEELAAAVAACARESGRPAFLIAESDANDPRLVRSPEHGGFGLDAMWCDDFHHAVHSLLTGERDGYYADYGEVDHLVRAWRRGLTYAGEYSEFRARRHGREIPDLEPRQVFVCVQNHDQVGNRMRGERFGELLDFESEKLAAGLLLLSPFVPLLFMGQEYGERRPFQYFVSHGDPDLVEAVRRGRREEFASFGWQGEVPDPQDPETMAACVLDQEARSAGNHAKLYALHRRLLEMRSHLRAFPDSVSGHDDERWLLVERPQARLWFHFGAAERRIAVAGAGVWRLALDSAADEWGGPGRVAPAEIGDRGEVVLQPRSFVVYTRAEAAPPSVKGKNT